MADWDKSSEEYQAEWDTWYKDYEVSEFLENSEENWSKVQELDPHLVWTDHSTCEDPFVTNGAHMFKGSCCWETHGWYIASTPWDGDENTCIRVTTGANLPCPSCNPKGENEDGVDGCEEEDCYGDGFIWYWFD